MARAAETAAATASLPCAPAPAPEADAEADEEGWSPDRLAFFEAGWEEDGWEVPLWRAREVRVRVRVRGERKAV
jgi:hypothetical protein